ncbi:hypothetical protein B9Y63_19385 [Stenotrophomonas maltophilia]|nr:hypothetical protein B9Y63_19385 [Stenotrophomonas maltophilia]PJL35632.1 hypothetical protein B9Y56_22320 [Stenotrophomonas maltophilia]
MSTPNPNLKPVLVELQLHETDSRGGGVSRMIASTARALRCARRSTFRSILPPQNINHPQEQERWNAL